MEGYLLSVILSLRTRMEGNLCTYIYIYKGADKLQEFACFSFCLLCFALLRFAEHASESLDPSMCLFLRGSLDNMLVIPFIMG